MSRLASQLRFPLFVISVAIAFASQLRAQTLYVDANNSQLMDDSNTGLQWLNLTQTLGTSYNDVTGAIANPASPLYGYSIANSDQVSQLLVDGGVPTDYQVNTPYGYLSIVQNIVSLWGPTWQGSQSWAIDSSPEPGSPGQLQVAVLSPPMARLNDYGILPGDNTQPTGVALYRPASVVPEPGTLTLLGSALLGLGLVCLRRASAKRGTR